MGKLSVTNDIELEGLEAHPAHHGLNEEIKKVEGVWNNLVATVKNVVKAVYNAMRDDDGPPEIVKQNETPIKVDEKERDGAPTTT